MERQLDSLHYTTLYFPWCVRVYVLLGYVRVVNVLPEHVESVVNSSLEVGLV